MLEGAAAALVPSVVSMARGLAATRDPLEAEMIAGDVLSTWHAGNPLDQEALDALGPEVLRRLGDRADPDVLALLIAIAAIAHPPLDGPARASVARLREAQVPEPIWAATIGRPALVDAWISTDELEDQAQVVATFAYERLPPHAIAMIVDRNF